MQHGNDGQDKNEEDEHYPEQFKVVIVLQQGLEPGKENQGEEDQVNPPPLPSAVGDNKNALKEHKGDRQQGDHPQEPAVWNVGRKDQKRQGEDKQELETMFLDKAVDPFHGFSGIWRRPIKA